MAEHEAQAGAAGATAEKGRKTLVTRLAVLAFMVAVIGGECIVAFLYLPGAAASGPAATTPADSHGEEAHEPEAAPSHEREVDLGKFSVSAFQAVSNTTLLIDFHLFGTVPLEEGASTAAAKPSGHGHGHGEKGAADDEFSLAFDKHKHRIRDQVIVIIRSAEIADFADPSLALIRRKILEKSNRMLGKPLLKEVIFSEFSLIEQ